MPTDRMSPGVRALKRMSIAGASLPAYGLAAALVGLLVVLKLVAHGSLGVDAPFLFMFGAIVLATWFGGRGPGLVTLVLGLMAVNFFFLPPFWDWHLTPNASLRIGVHGAEGLIIWWLTSSMQSAWQRAESASKRLEKLYAASSGLVNARSGDEVARTVVREAAAALSATSAAMYLATENGSKLRLVNEAGARVFERIAELPFDDNPIAAAAREGQPSCLGRVRGLRERLPELGAVGSDVKLMCAGIRLGDRVLGALLFAFPPDCDQSPDSRAVASVLANDCARALDRARVYDAERRARMDADEANRAKDEFLRMASHELRTPLTAISGWVHLLKKAGATDPKRYERGLDVIERNVQAQTRLVEDILDMSRIIARRLKVDAQPVDLSAVVRSCVDELAQVAAARGLRLTTSSKDQTIVTGDRERLAQIARNLVSNAIKFTPHGGNVWVDVEAQGGKAIFRVRDDGKGVPPEELPYLFEVFRQVDSSTTRRESGLGLGLPIVRHLVEAHGGTVRIESAGLGKGTTAVVELPLRAAAEDEQPRHPANDQSTPMLTGLRVLVVDDDADTGETVTQLLVDAGAEVRQARSAAEALEVLRNFLPDVLVSDIAMPDQDGYWLLRKVRSLGALHARMPAVALTALANPEDIRTARLAGFQRHLVKPPQPDVLAHTLAELVHSAA